MKDKLIFLIYIFLVLILTLFHNIYFFAIFLTVLFILSFRDFFYLLKKTIFSIFLFNSIVSISYIIFSILKNQSWIDYIILFNLRVFSLTYLTFFVLSKINLFNALSFSKTLTFLLVLSYSQILSFKKSYNDFRLSLKSRSITGLSLKDSYNYISSVFFFFFNKSLKNSEEISQAMKSRGFFND